MKPIVQIDALLLAVRLTVKRNFDTDDAAYKREKTFYKMAVAYIKAAFLQDL